MVSRLFASSHASIPPTLAQAIDSETSSTLKTRLETFFSDYLDRQTTTDPNELVAELSRALSLEKIANMTPADLPKTVEEMKALFAEAKEYLTCVDTPTSWTQRNALLQLIESFICVVETVIHTFGIGTLFQPATNQMDQERKAHKFFMLSTLFSSLSAGIIAIGGPVAPALISGVFFGIVALGLSWPYIHPMPNHLPAQAENWSKMARMGDFNEVDGRRPIIDAIAAKLHEGRHVLLVGKTRVGKTSIAQALAQGIEKGNYPNLKGKRVFYLKSPDLVGHRPSFFSGGGNRVLYDISDAMGRHSKDIILVFDEIHAFAKQESLLTEQMKHFLEQNGKFPHCIGITTDEEVRDLQGNKAFMSRFAHISVGNIDREENLSLLRRKAIRQGAIVDRVALEALLNKTAGNAQPHTSLSQLEELIVKTRGTQPVPEEEEISVIRERVLSISAKRHTQFGRLSQDDQSALAELQARIKELEEVCDVKRTTRDQVLATRTLLQNSLREAYRAIVEEGCSEQACKKAMLLLGVLIPLLQTRLNAQSHELNIDTVITAAMVEAMND